MKNILYKNPWIVLKAFILSAGQELRAIFKFYSVNFTYILLKLFAIILGFPVWCALFTVSFLFYLLYVIFYFVPYANIFFVKLHVAFYSLRSFAHTLIILIDLPFIMKKMGEDLSKDMTGKTIDENIAKMFGMENQRQDISDDNNIIIDLDKQDDKDKD